MGISSFHAYRPRLTALAAGVLALVLASASLPGEAAPVATLVVSTNGQTSGLLLDGRVEAVRQATVAAQISGNVLSLAVKAGDRVRAGQVLARIDERDAAAGLSRAEAAVAQAEAERQNAQLQLERQRELKRQSFVSQSAVDLAETQFKAAHAAWQQAQGARSQAALARGFATVTAPFDGYVLATEIQAGDLAGPGRPVATLYQPGALRAVVQLPVSRAALARQAGQTRVELPDGRWLTPLRRTELPVTDAVSQTVEWRLDLPADAQAGLTPGQSLRVQFDAPTARGAGTAATAAAAGLSLPAAAVLRRGELEAVYVAQPAANGQGGSFVLRAVRLGTPQAGGLIPVLAGLKAGEQVAADAVQAGLAGATPIPPQSAGKP